MQPPTVADTTVSLNLDGMAAASEEFERMYPDFSKTHHLDELRATEYARLGREGHVYLDYTGGGLYARSQLLEHVSLLSEEVFGNTHSKNLTSQAMTHLVEQAREYVLKY